mmetsp:Transcript_4799/g.6874  ORF Transcript_4799/g.6874 Transcript_4799/m.6874 type:complete len:218 (+) Transcript_4799:64-717(+)
MNKIILVLALAGLSCAFNFGGHSMDSMKMPSFGGDSDGGMKMPSFGGNGGHGMPSMSSMQNNMNQQMKNAEKAGECFMSQCSSQISTCQKDDDCKETMECTMNCQKEYKEQDKVESCQAGCASDMADNDAFQAVANCDGKCLIKAGVFPFTCFGDQCASEFSDCQNDKTCSEALACSNTCFGDEDCFKSCSSDVSGKVGQALFSCVTKCVMSNGPMN